MSDDNGVVFHDNGAEVYTADHTTPESVTIPPSASFSSIDFTKDSAPYWELDTFEDWGIEFESGTTTKVTNRTGGDATARIRITAPTASAGGTGGGATTLSELTDSTTATIDPLITENLAVGHFWINSTSGEAYVCTDATTGANVWTNIGGGSGNVPTVIYGGNVSTHQDASGVNYKTHTFTESDILTVDGASSVEVEIMVVGGGGSGGYGHGGGGGGGAVYHRVGYAVPSGIYPIIIGGGAASNSVDAMQNVGGETTAFSITATGGGSGSGEDSTPSSGSNGGGGAYLDAGAEGDIASYTEWVGYGGYSGGAGLPANAAPFSCGGGGGAGGAGDTGASTGGNGGVGVMINITGSDLYWGGGGGGSAYTGVSGDGGIGGGGGASGVTTGSASAGGVGFTNGDSGGITSDFQGGSGGANTGGGGGGGANEDGVGGTGGSGIVIVRYAI